MPEGNDLLATIEAAHAAALDETLWPDALAALARLFGATGATLEDFTKQPLGVRYFRITGLPARAETEYLAHYQHNNPRAEYAFRNLSQPILCDYALIDERAMDRHAYYAKYLIVARPALLHVRPDHGHAGRPGDRLDPALAPAGARREGATSRACGACCRICAGPTTCRGGLGNPPTRSAPSSTCSTGSADGVAIVRCDGRIVYANEAFAGARTTRRRGMHSPRRRRIRDWPRQRAVRQGGRCGGAAARRRGRRRRAGRFRCAGRDDGAVVPRVGAPAPAQRRLSRGCGRHRVRA